MTDAPTARIDANENAAIVASTDLPAAAYTPDFARRDYAAIGRKACAPELASIGALKMFEAADADRKILSNQELTALRTWAATTFAA